MTTGISVAQRMFLAPLRRLARLYGIQPAYHDVYRQRKEAAAESLLAVLRALGAPIESVHQAAEVVRQRKLQEWSRMLEPVVIVWNGEAGDLELRLPERFSSNVAKCRLRLEQGDGQTWEVDLAGLDPKRSARVEGTAYSSKTIRVPEKLPWGYHRLHVEVGGTAGETLLIATPPRAFQYNERTWGVFLPLYSLHSQRSWGAGDFSDLEALERWVKELGGGIASTLPFLASFLDTPFDPSPYAPASRLFWNEFYVDPTRSAEFDACEQAKQLVQSSEFVKEVAALRTAEHVDYRRQMTLKRRVLEALAQWLAENQQERSRAFRRYVRTHPGLEDYATFRAVCERQNAPWVEWPEPLRSGTLRESDYSGAAKLYHLYAQWLAEEQVSELAGKTNSSRTGLYLDLPLGVHPSSYDVWRHRAVFALNAAGGAPPDSVFTSGQNWAFPPLNPEAIRETRYEYLIACLRHQFAHAGLMRIDHVMGLHRLFWIPKGLPARDGVYVRYRAEELYAILCLESHRHSAEVVGENLGTVPAYVNAAMGRHGVQKMYVVQYETRSDRKRPLKPVPTGSVASLNTHDMPPFAAFLEGLDFGDRLELGLLSEQEAEREREVRRRIRSALGRFLHRRGSMPADTEELRAIMQGCLKWLSAGSSSVVLVNLEDLWLEREPQNLPGTGAERPNWQKKARHSLEEFSNMFDVVEPLRALNELRGADRRR